MANYEEVRFMGEGRLEERDRERIIQKQRRNGRTRSTN